jgi:hypothetical protein
LLFPAAQARWAAISWRYILCSSLMYLLESFSPFRNRVFLPTLNNARTFLMRLDAELNFWETEGETKDLVRLSPYRTLYSLALRPCFWTTWDPRCRNDKPHILQISLSLAFFMSKIIS